MSPDITGVVKDYIPSLGSFSFGFNLFTWILIAIIFLIGVGAGAFFFMRWMKYNKRIIIFEKIGGRFEKTREDRAMETRLTTGGDTIFYLRRHKKYLPNPTLQTGRRVYWYWIREDGEWINFCPGDFDEDARQMHAHFLDKEMRYARSQVQRALKERYDKPGFWKQYGAMAFSIAFIAIIGIMAWLLFREWTSLAAASTRAVEKSGEVIEKVGTVLGALDNICKGGSGIIPA